MPFNGQVDEEGFDRRLAKLARVTLVVEQDIALDPIEVTILGVARIMVAPMKRRL